jgi:glycosyltransferase involved in cell wall biosynthesis
MLASKPKRPDGRLKVLHLLVTMPVGGAEDLVAAIVGGLDPARFAAGVACLGLPGPVGEELAAAGFPVISLGFDLKHTSTWRLAAAVRRLLREQRPDILHTHLYHPNLYGRLAALGLGLSGVVASVHNSYSRVKFHRRLWNYLLARVTDRILVASPQVWEDLRRYDGAPASRLLLLPYGIRLEELDTPVSREEARQALGVTGFILGAVGRLEEQKGHAHLLEALARVQEEMPDALLLLVGDGRRRVVLEDQARESGLAERVRFLGTRRDLPLIYRALDLFVQPSLWEGLPLALLQAMGAGLPVLATEVSGVREVVADGVNGRLAPPGAPAALAAALVELYRQPEARARIGAAAHLTIREHYSLSAMLNRLEQLYLELGEKSPRRPRLAR